jgi:zinc protease
MRVREELGLAYYVGAQNMAGLVPGYFAFYCGTAPETAAEAAAIFRSSSARRARSNGKSVADGIDECTT